MKSPKGTKKGGKGEYLAKTGATAGSVTAYIRTENSGFETRLVANKCFLRYRVVPQ